MSGETNCVIGGGRNRANRNRQGLALPAAVEKGTKIKLGADHGGKRNLLLPSRMMMGSASSVNLSGIPVPIKAKTLQNSYEVYLQALLTDLVVQQAQSLQVKISLETSSKKVWIASLVKKKVNRILLTKWSSSYPIIWSQCENLAVFFMEIWRPLASRGRILLQILGALSTKFDRIILEGGGESGGSFFLFHEVNEMRRLMDQLMRDGSKLDTDSSFGFGFLLKEALKDIRIKIEVAKGTTEVHPELEGAAGILLIGHHEPFGR
ncbi:hypothetical protein Ocin01_17851 [Orchesella cincta]|uniref:Uncharacterized protein n=1 Tax=Orchesella cincta TaxID=48709 RepID=A0A1D2M7C8_ORCCI|nr:hypothetical protein Ocin01_17851 [Orchesella cincta]